MTERYPVSGAVFIKDTFRGAFTLFESLASVLPFVDDVTVLDLGSTDGTLHYLHQIERHNPRIRVVKGEFPETDAGAFATLANDMVRDAKHDNVWFWQSDEIPHQGLLTKVDECFSKGQFDLTFWRIQYHNNFQYVKWFPQPVHRVGVKGRFNFTGDGMSTDRTFDAQFCGDYDGGWFYRWGELGQEGVKPYVNQMLLDVSLIGAFRDNIPERRRMHAPFWREEPKIPYKDKGQEGETWMAASDWMAKANNDPDWTKETSPYNLPKIMRYHVGKTRYELRRELFDALCRDETRGLLGV